MRSFRSDVVALNFLCVVGGHYSTASDVDVNTILPSRAKVFFEVSGVAPPLARAARNARANLDSPREVGP
jgi:hypothetical protein